MVSICPTSGSLDTRETESRDATLFTKAFHCPRWEPTEFLISGKISPSIEATAEFGISNGIPGMATHTVLFNSPGVCVSGSALLVAYRFADDAVIPGFGGAKRKRHSLCSTVGGALADPMGNHHRFRRSRNSRSFRHGNVKRREPCRKISEGMNAGGNPRRPPHHLSRNPASPVLYRSARMWVRPRFIASPKAPGVENPPTLYFVSVSLSDDTMWPFGLSSASSITQAAINCFGR
ncbi:hypothetical protein HOY80DRAFT_1026154 [Tuber brumale]|nr:hypothetical protein HOY80DRAFT_1026154 [Tuber brumale]